MMTKEVDKPDEVFPHAPGRRTSDVAETTLEIEKLRTVKLSNELLGTQLELEESEVKAKTETLAKTQAFRNTTYKHTWGIILVLHLHIMLIAYLVYDLVDQGKIPVPYGIFFAIILTAFFGALIFFTLNRMFPQESKKSPVALHALQQTADLAKKTVESVKSDGNKDDKPDSG